MRVVYTRCNEITELSFLVDCINLSRRNVHAEIEHDVTDWVIHKSIG